MGCFDTAAKAPPLPLLPLQAPPWLEELGLLLLLRLAAW